eukprot:gene23789-30058_t
MERMKLAGIKIDIRYESAGYVIINKLSGVSVAPDKEYEKALKILLWDGKYRDSCKLLYHLEKSLNGLCIIAQTTPDYKRIREMMVGGTITTTDADGATKVEPSTPPQIALTYRAVVCGFIGEAGTTVDIPTTYYDMPTLSVQVISTSRCRSCNYLSLVDISPLMFTAKRMGTADRAEYTLTNDPAVSHIRDKYQMYTESFLDSLERPVTGADYKVLHYPTKYIKSVKRALMRAGHAVVGDGDMVKKSKGIHAALVRIRIGALVNTTSSDVFEPVVIEVPTPDKFAKLLVREERMWHLANDRDQDKLQEHKERQNTGGRRGNKNKKTKACSADSDIATELESTHIAPAHPNECDDVDNDSADDLNDDDEGEDEDSSSGSDSEDDRATVSGLPSDDHDLPVEYRIGEAAFCGSIFAVSPHVMIPRKSSEALVSEAVRLLAGEGGSEADARGGARALDLGTGSGCLLLSCIAQLSRYFHESSVSGVGLDISLEALSVARDNASRLNLTDRTHFMEGSFDNLLEALKTTGGDRPFDLILCNPPYSSKKDRTRLSVSRRSHEPEVALYAPRSVSINSSGESSDVLQGGTMGAYHMIALSMRVIHLHQIDSVSNNDTLVIRDGAHLVVEMGHGQERQVRAIFDAARCLTFVHSVRDHLDIVRCVVYKYCLHSGA